MKKTLENLEPDLANIVRSVECGWDEGQRWLQTSHVILSKSPVANVINEYIFAQVRRNFEPERCVGDRNTLRGLIAGGAFIKFKKLNRRFRTANIQTRQIAAYNRQYPVPGLEDMEHLVVGWLPDATETELVGIYLLKPKSSGENEWRVDLRMVVGAGASLLPPLVSAMETEEENVVNAAAPKLKDTALVRRKQKAVNG